jgi:diguanylate cyclase (GGDEF)-like protein
VSATPGLLVVDDNEMNREWLSRRLRRQGYEVSVASSGPEALDAITQLAFQLVLLDIEMPGMSGLTVLEKIRARHSASDLPVIMVSARHESDTVVAALNGGANDYVTKPVDFPIALARIESQLARRIADITRGHTDQVTGLPNRSAAFEWWNRSTGDLAIVVVNLDRFRLITNSFGRSRGDVILKEVGERLQTCVPGDSIVARTTGDEFVCLFHGNPDRASAVASRMVAALREPFLVDNQPLFIAGSAGVMCPTAGCPFEEVLGEVDTALYRAKTLGGNRFERFDSSLRSRALARLQLETELRRALAEGAFELRYQPIIALGEQTIAGFEALVRWRHPSRGEMAPHEFISVAEETGLIRELGTFVLRKGCQQLTEWQHRFGDLPITLSVNVSSKQLADPSFVDTVQHIIQETGVNPCRLNLELTETVLMEATEQTRLVLQRLAALCVKVSLDDFGTGYSSLSYLQNFPVNALKVAQSFISGFTESSTKRQIVRAILSLAHSCGLRVVAEGIESVTQLDELRALGCDFGQGFFLSEPLNAHDAGLAFSHSVQAT